MDAIPGNSSKSNELERGQLERKRDLLTAKIAQEAVRVKENPSLSGSSPAGGVSLLSRYQKELANVEEKIFEADMSAMDQVAAAGTGGGGGAPVVAGGFVDETSSCLSMHTAPAAPSSNTGGVPLTAMALAEVAATPQQPVIAPPQQQRNQPEIHVPPPPPPPVQQLQYPFEGYGNNQQQQQQQQEIQQQAPTFVHQQQQPTTTQQTLRGCGGPVHDGWGTPPPAGETGAAPMNDAVGPPAGSRPFVVMPQDHIGYQSWHAPGNGGGEFAPCGSLLKTKLCYDFKYGQCDKGSRCTYAHGDAELRAGMTATTTYPPPPPMKDFSTPQAGGGILQAPPEFQQEQQPVIASQQQQQQPPLFPPPMVSSPAEVVPPPPAPLPAATNFVAPPPPVVESSAPPVPTSSAAMASLLPVAPPKLAAAPLPALVPTTYAPAVSSSLLTVADLLRQGVGGSSARAARELPTLPTFAENSAAAPLVPVAGGGEWRVVPSGPTPVPKARDHREDDRHHRGRSHSPRRRSRSPATRRGKRSRSREDRRHRDSRSPPSHRRQEGLLLHPCLDVRDTCAFPNCTFKQYPRDVCLAHLKFSYNQANRKNDKPPCRNSASTCQKRHIDWRGENPRLGGGDGRRRDRSRSPAMRRGKRSRSRDGGRRRDDYSEDSDSDSSSDYSDSSSDWTSSDDDDDDHRRRTQDFDRRDDRTRHNPPSAAAATGGKVTASGPRLGGLRAIFSDPPEDWVDSKPVSQWSGITVNGAGEVIEISRSILVKHTVADWSKFPSTLQKLDVSFTGGKVTDHAIKLIATHCTGLQRLSVGGTEGKVTDDAIKLIATQCTGLQFLNVRSTGGKVTDASLKLLGAQCKVLKLESSKKVCVNSRGEGDVRQAGH